MNRPIKAKERETIIQSLKSGVVPRAGLQHIQVGRSEELKSFIKDINTIAEGACHNACRSFSYKEAAWIGRTT